MAYQLEIEEDETCYYIGWYQNSFFGYKSNFLIVDSYRKSKVIDKDIVRIAANKFVQDFPYLYKY